MSDTPYTEGGYMLKPPSNTSRASKDHREHLSEETHAMLRKEGETP